MFLFYLYKFIVHDIVYFEAGDFNSSLEDLELQGGLDNPEIDYVSFLFDY